MFKAMLVGCALAGVMVGTARADSLHNMQVVRGHCTPDSHTSFGPAGSDLTKGQRRAITCDTAVIAFLDAENNHMLIQFVDKKRSDATIIGFGGYTNGSPNIVNVEHIYLKSGEPPLDPVSGAGCSFHFKGRHLDWLICGGRIDAGESSLAAVVPFQADPGQ